MPRILYPAALLLLVSGAPALADVTAEEVWQTWTRAAAENGLTLTATERSLARRLDLRDVRLEMGGADGGTLRLDSLSLVEGMDGSVSVVLPPTFPLRLFPAQPVGFRSVDFTVSAPDFTAHIRDLGEALDFDLSATSVSVELDEASIRRAEVADSVALSLSAADLAVNWRQQTVSFPKTLDGSLSLGTVHAELAVDSQNGLKATASLDLSGVKQSLVALAPAELEAMDNGSAEDELGTLLRAFDNGFAVRAEGSYGPVALIMDAVDPTDGPLFVDFASSGGNVLLALDKVAAIYRVSLAATRIKALLNDPSSPIQDLDSGLTEYTTEVSIGIGDLVSPQAWTAVLRMTGAQMPEQVWAEFDPGAVLPRDPLSIVADLSGTWALDPAALAPGWTPPSPDTFPPLSVLTAALDEMVLSGLGAQVSGTGAVTFDMGDLVTYEGMPAPTGTLSFAARGLNGLIDRLARLGALTEDEITAARFGLLFITKAGAEPDSVTSEVILDGASITLNGQKLR